MGKENREKIMINFTIPGNPASSKNSRPIFINKATGARFIGKSKLLKDYIDRGLLELNIQKRDLSYAYKFPREMDIQVTFLFYVQDKRRRDLVNLMQAPLDLLQAAEIISDDSIVKSLDGSRIYYDKLNPRTEISIIKYKEIK
jgi:Holliday junction resolvase RusA-like endonuclease